MVPALGAGAVVMAAGHAGVARAQIQNVQKYHAVVTQGQTPLRCGDREGFYRVGELSEGQVVVVDGEDKRWARVTYPAGVTAFVRADEATPTAGGKSVRITKSTKLRARNATHGFAGSWRSLLINTVEPGLELTLIETTRDDSGNVEAYVVVPPEEARGYVELSALRRATDAEVARFESGAGSGMPVATGNTGNATPARGTTSNEPATQENTRVASNDEPQRPISLIQPMNTEGTTTPSSGPSNGSSSGATGVSTGNEPIEVAHGEPTTTPVTAPVTNEPVATPAQPEVRAIGSPEALDSKLDQVRRQPPMEAELSELLTEYQRAREAASQQSDSESLVARLDQRVQFLELQIDWQRQMRELQESKARLAGAMNESDKAFAALYSAGGYTIIGRLAPSTVYDGKSLPLMYRVMSVGGAVSRTIAYVRPEPEFQLHTRIDRVVGIVGDATLDPSLNLNIVRPLRVDLLQPIETAVVQPDAGDGAN
jgi:hypothetical protein